MYHASRPELLTATFNAPAGSKFISGSLRSSHYPARRIMVDFHTIALDNDSRAVIVETFLSMH
ncbi:MAG TPA: hypothetical protein VKB27_19000 [Gammaproteobacteria bacterium]|nr:hypothetical protein [Gammaproteobacteria bacterium]